MPASSRVDWCIAPALGRGGLRLARRDMRADIGRRQAQRTGEEQFDLYVFRSFARSFWKMLGHAAEEVGYEVV